MDQKERVAITARLVAGQKLCFIEQHTVDIFTLKLPLHDRKQIITLFECKRLGFKANSGLDDPCLMAIVQGRSKQHRRHAALTIVVGRLEQNGRLAGIHRRIIEIELSHRLSEIRESGPGPPGVVSARAAPANLRAWHSRAPIPLLPSGMGICLSILRIRPNR